MRKQTWRAAVSAAAIAAGATFPMAVEAETYYFAFDTATQYNAANAWTNAVGTAITLTGSTTYRNDDFIVGANQTITTSGTGAHGIYCKSLLLQGSEAGVARFTFSGSSLANCNLVLGGYGELRIFGRSSKDSGVAATSTVYVDDSATSEAPARITSTNTSRVNSLWSPISGSGTLWFGSPEGTAIGVLDLSVSCPDFTGCVKVAGRSGAVQELQFNGMTDGGCFGDPASFEERGLELEYAKLTVNSDFTLTENRGLYVSADSTISVASGKTLTLPGSLAFNLYDAESAPVLTFSGEGTFTIPDTVKVKVTASDGVQPVGFKRVLTSGGRFSGATVVLDEGSDPFARSVSVNPDGDIEVAIVDTATYYYNKASGSPYDTGAWTNAAGTAVTVQNGNNSSKEYYLAVGANQTITTSGTGAHGIYCKSMLLQGSDAGAARFTFRGSALANCNLVLGGYGELQIYGREKSNSGVADTSTVYVDDSATSEAPARVMNTNASRVNSLWSPISGPGTLWFGSPEGTAVGVLVLGVSCPDFTGCMKVSGRSDAVQELQFNGMTDGGCFGDPASFEERGLELEYAKLTVNSDFTLTENRGLYVSADSTISVASGKTLTLPSSLAFNFTDRKNAPVLTFAGDGTVSVPSSVNVAVSVKDGILPTGGKHVLTSGGRFSGCTIAGSMPEWGQSIYVDTNGDIVLSVKPKGLRVIVR